MRHCRLLLISIFIIGVLTTSSMAAIKTVTYNSELFTSIGGELVDWSDNHTFPYFDPDMGRLISVYFTATLNGTLYGEAENKATRPVEAAWMGVDTDMYVVMLNGQHLPLYVLLRVPSNGSSVNVGPYDQIHDFLGSDSFNGTDANDAWDDIFYINAADVSDYVGTGTFNLSTVTSALSIVHGGGSWWSNITTKAWSIATITYTYDDSRCLSGYKFDGCTGLPLSGWKIKVNNSTHEWNTTTDGNGFWRICQLENDTYTVCEVLQPGWAQTSPMGCHTVPLAGINITNINFTNQKMYCISGYKKDNCTGAPLSGWNITLQNATGATSQLTGRDGKYEFCNLKPGDYTITEEARTGYIPFSVVANPVTLNCSNITNQNFTNQALLCISGYKLDECTNSGIENWLITLNNSSYTTSNLTGSDGKYEFCNLIPGRYTLTEETKDGYISSGQISLDVNLPCGSNLTDQNFTNQKLLCISGYKLDDNTGLGLENWTIIIYNETGMEINRTTTDGSGYYQFCDLSPGVYRIYEEIKEGWTQLSPVGWLPPLAPVYPATTKGGYHEVPLYCDNVTDKNFVNARLLCINGSKVNQCTDEPLAGWTINLHDETGAVINTTATDGNGRYSFCGLLSGNYTVCEVLQGNWKNITDICIPVELESENKENINFRNAPLGCLAGYKLNERDSGLEGWTIEVRNASGFVNSSVTNSSGFWQVCGLHPGTYEVSEISQGNYKNLSPSTVTVDLVDCPEGNLINFKNTLPGCIEGFKLNYSDGKGLAGWTIEVRDSTGALVGNTTTDSTGHWQFCGLENGTYTVCEVAEPGWMPKTPRCLNVTMEGENKSDINFINMELLCLSGHKFHHLTGEGLAGWTIVVNNTTDSWEIVTDANGFWQKCNLTPGQYTVCEVLKPGWTQVSPIDCYDVPLIDKSISGLDFYNNPGCNLTLTKTADKETAKRGENVTYNITLTNPCADQGLCFNNVTLWDVLPNGVQFVSANPAPSSSSATTLYWDIGTFCSGEFKAQIVVRVPIVDINYDMEQGVSGEGFVNVHNDYDTHQGPESITNCAYAEADLQPTISDCVTTKIVDPGTELLRREFGSGDYASEELLRLRTENKSIRSVTSLSAEHKPTSFALPGNRSIDYGTKWTEKSKAINTITGATMTEEYTFAQKIDKERAVDLDKNGSTMKTDVAFTGTGHIGVLKKRNPDSHPRIDPTYEAVEDYTGTFRVYELVDEYGKSVKSEKNVSGYGYVAVDKRVGASQRTYESGTGSYQSDELIETPTNYIAKDIRLVHGPTNYSYSPGFATNQNIKWSEGMWSKSGYLAGGVMLAGNSSCGSLIPTGALKGSQPASLISERYSGLDYLDKETVASGLNEMNTEASFSGTADYQVKAIFSNKSGEIENEDRYVGKYDITRKVQLTGVSRYDRPHITVAKKGKMTKRFFNKTMADVMEYAITITNDGSRSLGPINIRDIFPPGTEYIGSSIRPDSQSNREANWSLLNLGIGGSITLKLELNVTEFAPCSLVNRVMVCGMDGEECAAGAAYHVVECGELPCCPPDLVLDKSAEQEPSDPALIHYTIAVQNKGNSSVAATLKDLLPAGLEFVEASPRPSRQEGQFLEWILPDLEKDGLEVIEYSVRATMDGVYVNAVHADASAVDGSGYDTADAAAKVEVWSTGVAPRTTRYGDWQVPDWNMTSPDQGITVDLSPEEDLVG